MVIDLGQYRTARRRKAVAQPALARHEEERLCANWMPTRGIATSFCYRDPRLMSPQLPDDLAAIDVEEFIDRLRTLASQI